MSVFLERDLAKVGIIADVRNGRAGIVTVTLSDDDLDAMIEAHGAYLELDEKLNEAEANAHDVGFDAGHADGYEEACNDVVAELGAAWEIVKPLLTVRYDDGYADAIADIKELGT